MKTMTLFISLILFTSCSSLKRNTWYNSDEMLHYSNQFNTGDIIILKAKHNLEQMFGHCALILDNKNVGEYGKSIKAKKIIYENLLYSSWIKKNKKRKFKIFRLKKINKNIKNQINNISDKYHGGRYAVFTSKKNPKKVYCSSWIWQIYKKVLDVDIDSNKGFYVFPYDFMLSDYLEEIKISADLKNKSSKNNESKFN